MWFDTWDDIGRTLTKLDAFDLVVTVALGSTLATSTLTSSDDAT